MAGVAQEVKAEILLKVKSGEKVADLAKQYGVSDKSIYNWLKGKLEQEVSYREYKRVLKENEQLKNILGVLTLELEKSKKRSELTQRVITKHPDTSKRLLSQVFDFLGKPSTLETWHYLQRMSYLKSKYYLFSPSSQATDIGEWHWH